MDHDAATPADGPTDGPTDSPTGVPVGASNPAPAVEDTQEMPPVELDGESAPPIVAGPLPAPDTAPTATAGPTPPLPRPGSNALGNDASETADEQPGEPEAAVGGRRVAWWQAVLGAAAVVLAVGGFTAVALHSGDSGAPAAPATSSPTIASPTETVPDAPPVASPTARPSASRSTVPSAAATKSASAGPAARPSSHAPAAPHRGLRPSRLPGGTHARHPHAQRQREPLLHPVPVLVHALTPDPLTHGRRETLLLAADQVRAASVLARVVRCRRTASRLAHFCEQ
ncbi:hypothetical protein GCM10023235_11320 [Kitasatospora terrestris]|uniref:Uncharacterized protein n=1 Tax=Kitasatospora terrestris TaxID=258051 RepID=A0ABP9DEZ0_9ACTN